MKRRRRDGGDSSCAIYANEVVIYTLRFSRTKAQDASASAVTIVTARLDSPLEVAKGLPARCPFVLQRAIAMLVVGGDRGCEMRVGGCSSQLRSLIGLATQG